MKRPVLFEKADGQRAISDRQPSARSGRTPSKRQTTTAERESDAVFTIERLLQRLLEEPEVKFGAGRRATWMLRLCLAS
jgi:hypothetical protein